MDINSAVYNKLNGFQVRDGKELINRISRDRSGIMDVIVDVGSGSGNVTKLLGNAIPHNRILALDIDPNMVKFAEENYSAPDVTYIVQDIGQPWDKIDPKIRDLEGSVDLIFSNYVLVWVWVKDMETAFENLFKLLKPGGAIYFTFPTHRLDHPSFKIDSAEVHRSKICNILKAVGFHDVDLKTKEDHWEYNSPEDLQEILKQFRDYYFRYIISETRDELRSELEEYVYRICSVGTGQDIPDKFDLQHRTLFYATHWGRAEKRN